jgi:hypothetical protein
MHAKPACLTVKGSMKVSDNAACAFSGTASLTSACPKASCGLCWIDCRIALSKCLKSSEAYG